MLIHDRTPVLTPFPGFACLFRFIYLLCRYLVSFLLSWLLYGCMWIFLSRLYNLRAHCFRRFWQKRRGRGAREAAGKSVLTIWTTLTTSGDVSILNAEPCASFTPGAENSRGGPNVPPPRTGSAARLRLLCGAPVLLNLRVGTSTRNPDEFSGVDLTCGRGNKRGAPQSLFVCLLFSGSFVVCLFFIFCLVWRNGV